MLGRRECNTSAGMEPERATVAVVLFEIGVTKLFGSNTKKEEAKLNFQHRVLARPLLNER